MHVTKQFELGVNEWDVFFLGREEEAATFSFGLLCCQVTDVHLILVSGAASLIFMHEVAVYFCLHLHVQN